MHISTASSQAPAQYAATILAGRRKVWKGFSSLGYQHKLGVSSKCIGCSEVIVHVHRCTLEANARPLWRLGMFSHPSQLCRVGKLFPPPLYSHSVSICCPQVTGKALGTAGWRHIADRAAGLDTGFSSPSRPTVLVRCSLQGKYSSCPDFQMKLG